MEDNTEDMVMDERCNLDALMQQVLIDNGFKVVDCDDTRGDQMGFFVVSSVDPTLMYEVVSITIDNWLDQD